MTKWDSASQDPCYIYSYNNRIFSTVPKAVVTAERDLRVGTDNEIIFLLKQAISVRRSSSKMMVLWKLMNAT